jgi:cysteine desulfurase
MRQDQQAFMQETGLAPKDTTVPGAGVSGDTAISPVAGILKQATVMDEGQRPIYLDMQATTPTDPRVLDAMLPFLTGLYGNPHSRTHAYGWETDKAVEQARQHIADLIGADAKEIIFTSGATESNNMSVKGVARFFKKGGKKNHIITCQTEHKCVLDSCRHLQEEGFEVTYLPVQSNGLIDMEELEKAIKPETCLVSIMTVNNEIGVVQPVEEIGRLCRSKKVYFHTDAAQAVGKIPIDVNRMNVDLMSISGHKIYGPKGIGACYVRRRPRVRIDPIISGGGQERGLRSGTLAPPLVIGMGEAARICKEELAVRLLFPFICSRILLVSTDDYMLLHMHGFLSWRFDRRIWRAERSRGYDNDCILLDGWTRGSSTSLTAPTVRRETNSDTFGQAQGRSAEYGAHITQRRPNAPLPWLCQRLICLC